MRTLVLVRHAESEFSVVNRLNGDVSVDVKLSEAGRQQARELGRRIGKVDLVAHTEFARTRETAELAWPSTPTIVIPELNEIAFGRFEGTHWSEGYHDWVVTSEADEACPGGGESRVAAVQRYLHGYRVLLARAEARVVLVGHGAAVRYVLLALEDKRPTRVLEGVDPATPFVLDSTQVERAVEVLEEWAGAPSF